MSESDVPVLKFVDDEPAAKYWNFLLYGPAKNGKTVAACSAPGPILLLTCQGPASYRFARSQFPGKLNIVKYENKQTIAQVIAYIKAGGKGEQTIVIDTLGDIHGHALHQVGGKKPQIQHYGQANDVVFDLVTDLRDLPINVVFVCHEQIDDSEEGGAMRRPLTGGKKLPEQVMGEVDIIAYCGVIQPDEKKPPQYIGQLVQAKGRRAGDRSGALGSTRPLNLAEWVETANTSLKPDESDIPFSPDFEPPAEDPADPDRDVGAEAFAEPVQAELGAPA
jgi:hypothetical protein